MFNIILAIYLLTFALPICSYAVYPVIIWIIAKIFPLKINLKEITPHISIIISAYNEERNIARKLKNTLALEYPRDKFEILVGSDGSTDNTGLCVKPYIERGVQFVDFKLNRGKTAVQNELVKRSKGEILIFTDAASFLTPNTVKKIVRNFADNRVGCVAGRMRFVDTDTNLNTQSQGLYWRYEMKIREIESGIGGLIGVDGPLYAVRRDNYVPLGNNIISDLITPLLVLEQSKKVVLEHDAVVEEGPTLKTTQEFNTRRRITLRGLAGISSYRSLLNPIRHPLLVFQIFFHKILRWFIGSIALLNVVACIALSTHWIFKTILATYLFFFLASALGYLFARFKIKCRILTVPYYFCLVNFAATMGIVDFFRRKQVITWETIRD